MTTVEQHWLAGLRGSKAEKVPKTMIRGKSPEVGRTSPEEDHPAPDTRQPTSRYPGRMSRTALRAEGRRTSPAATSRQSERRQVERVVVRALEELEGDLKEAAQMESQPRSATKWSPRRSAVGRSAQQNKCLSASTISSPRDDRTLLDTTTDSLVMTTGSEDDRVGYSKTAPAAMQAPPPMTAAPPTVVRIISHPALAAQQRPFPTYFTPRQQGSITVQGGVVAERVVAAVAQNVIRQPVQLLARLGVQPSPPPLDSPTKSQQESSPTSTWEGDVQSEVSTTQSQPQSTSSRKKSRIVSLDDLVASLNVTETEQASNEEPPQAQVVLPGAGAQQPVIVKQTSVMMTSPSANTPVPGVPPSFKVRALELRSLEQQPMASMPQADVSKALGRVAKTATEERDKMDEFIQRLSAHGLGPEPENENASDSEDDQRENCVAVMMRRIRRT